MKYRQKAYIWLVMLAGAVALGLCIAEISELIIKETILFMHVVNWIIMLTLLVLCRALPVYIAKDKSIELSFVPVVASAMVYGRNLRSYSSFYQHFFFLLLMKIPEGFIISFQGR